MPKISDDIIKAVLDEAKIEDVVGDFVTLRKAGVNLTGICPFHDDHSDGNFIVRPSSINEKNHGNTYRCFVCDAKGGPVQFLMNAEHMSFPDAIRYLGKKYSIEVDNVPLNWTPPPPRPTPPPLPVLEIPRSWVARTMELAQADSINLIRYLFDLPWSAEEKGRLRNTLWQYCVGGWKDGRVVFWQIDHNGVPRAAKLMKFHPKSHLNYGHRDKDAHPGWIYNQDGCRQVCKPDEHQIIKPLFGSHLLKRYPNADVNIVESEKTAIIMANYYGSLDSQLWLACGGLKFLQLDSMQPLIDQGRRVWLWPDKDGVEDWQKIADKLGSDKVQVYTRFFDSCWLPEDGDKADAADIAIRMMSDPTFKPREIQTEGQQGVTDQNATAVSDHGATLPHSDEPFLDPEEMADPQVHRWREIMRKAYPGKKHRPTPPTTNIEGVKSVGEILKEHPLLKKLINNESE